MTECEEKSRGRKSNLDDSSVVSAGKDDRVVISGHGRDGRDAGRGEYSGRTCRQGDVTTQRTVP